jgi:hypothetical protein
LRPPPVLLARTPRTRVGDVSKECRKGFAYSREADGKKRRRERREEKKKEGEAVYQPHPFKRSVQRV